MSFEKLKEYSQLPEFWIGVFFTSFAAFAGINGYLEWRRQQNLSNQGGMFGGKPIKVHDYPIPVHKWPTNREGNVIFQPTYDWQEVPENCVLPPGLQIEADMKTGVKKARAIRRY